eukprot:6186383-Pleurochrysis_carterae.AAC.4
MARTRNAYSSHLASVPVVIVLFMALKTSPALSPSQAYLRISHIGHSKGGVLIAVAALSQSHAVPAGHWALPPWPLRAGGFKSRRPRLLIRRAYASVWSMHY